MVHKKNAEEKIIVSIFFLTFLIVGLSLVNDYGLSYDEPMVRYRGIVNLNYILEGDRTLFEYSDRYHGPVFDILLVVFERVFHLTDSRIIYVTRHLLTFLVFYLGVIFFYRLSQKRFHDWKISLWGCLFLILSPRMFAHAFYNSKDVPFMSFFIISIYTLLSFLEQKSWITLFWHALLSAILIDLRILGLLVPCLTWLCLVWELLATRPLFSKKFLVSGILYTLLSIAFTIAFFPVLWENPLHHFVQAFFKMQQFPWGLQVLYLGKYIEATNLPWHYIPVWIIITTPLVVVILFIYGLGVLLTSWWKMSVAQFFSRPMQRIDMIFCMWFFSPILAVILFHSVVYDGWRHLFFVYPALLLIALHGLQWLFTCPPLILQSKRFTRNLFLMMIIVSLSEPVSFMIWNHPFQYLYFNRLAGKDMTTIKQKFELDYWGLSYTTMLHYIAMNDPDKHLNIVIDRFPRNYCTSMLSAIEREKITCIRDIRKAKYFVGNYRMNKEGYPCTKEFHALQIDNTNIAVAHETTSCIIK